MGEKEIVNKAKQLGKTIGKSKVWKDFTKASEKFNKDGKVQKLLVELRRKEREQEEKLRKGMPIEISEKQEIKRLEEELSQNEFFLNFVTCENRYLALLEKIEKAIKEGSEETVKSEEERIVSSKE